MFNGIIEETGLIKKIRVGEGFIFTIKAELTKKIKKGSSVAINGVCTTVIKKDKNQFSFFASRQTLDLTNLKKLKVGDLVNLETALKWGGTIDGHLVYGHVDKTTKLKNILSGEESILLTFGIDKKNHSLLIKKGSIAINGISLTLYQLVANTFKVMIIPYTYKKTNLHLLKKGDEVNLEFDAFGKYLKGFYQEKIKSKS